MLDKPTYMIDPSAMKNMACDRKFLFTVKDGYHYTKLNPAMEWGSAFHTFAASYYKGTELKESMQAGLVYYQTRLAQGLRVKEKDQRNLVRLVEAITLYAKKYPLEKDSFKVEQNSKGACIEQSFGIPLYCGEKYNIVFSGTIDLIGTYRGEKVFMDHKTTSNYLTQSGKFFESYELDTQFLAYNWALSYLANLKDSKLSEYKNAGGLVNGIFNTRSKVEFERSPLIEYPDHLRASFDKYMRGSFLKKVRDLIENGPSSYGWACDSCSLKFGKCCYWEVCNRPDGVDAETMMTMLDYETKPYNPLNHGRL